MKVIEVKEKIDELKKIYENIMSLQNLALIQPNNAHIQSIEEGADIYIHFRPLMSEVLTIVDGEINRLNKIIDNADVKID